MNRVIQCSEDELLALIRRAIKEELDNFKTPANNFVPPLTKKEACKFLGVSIPVLDNLIKTNQLKAFNIGKSVRIKQSDMDLFIQNKASL